MPSPSSEYEIERLRLPRTVSRRFVRQLLVDRAEHDGWELDRLRLYPDGQRVVTLRRKIIRARKTMGSPMTSYRPGRLG